MEGMHIVLPEKVKKEICERERRIRDNKRGEYPPNVVLLLIDAAVGLPVRGNENKIPYCRNSSYTFNRKITLYLYCLCDCTSLGRPTPVSDALEHYAPYEID